MRVLYLTPRFPGLGLRGDQSRAYEQIRHLSREHAITLLAAAPPEPALREHAALSDWCEAVHLQSPDRWRRLVALLAAVPRGRPWQQAWYSGWPDSTTLASLLLSPVDLVHVQMVRLASVLPRLAGNACVVDLVDALSLNMARRAAHQRGALAWLAAREAGRLRPLEQAVCTIADGIAVSSADDLAALPPPRRHAIVANGVDPEQFAYRAGRSGNTLLFAGNLGYFPNVDGALWFAEQVLPLVRRTIGDARLRLVGANPSQRLHRLAAGRDDIELVGPVADMPAALHAATLAICPLRAGSGQQLKLLEAMSAGTPVVSLRRAAEAVDADDGGELRIADDAEGMAAAIVELLRDREAATAMAARAREHVVARFTWAAAARSLDTLWRRAAGNAGR